MRHLLLFLVILLNPVVLFAQNKVYGDIVDTDKNPLEGVIIQAKDVSTKKMVAYTKSDAKGNFLLSVPAGCYLECAYLGLKKKEVHDIISCPLHIVMEPDKFTLKEVHVKADKVRIKGDTLNYTVGAFASKNDKSIGDVLARIPDLTSTRKTGRYLMKVSRSATSISKEWTCSAINTVRPRICCPKRMWGPYR